MLYRRTDVTVHAKRRIKSGTEGADRTATSPFMSVSRGLRTQDSVAVPNPQLPFSSPETRQDIHAGQLASWSPCSQTPSCVDGISFSLSSWHMQLSRREGKSFSAGQSASALICTGIESHPIQSSPVQSEWGNRKARRGEVAEAREPVEPKTAARFGMALHPTADLCRGVWFSRNPHDSCSRMGIPTLDRSAPG